MKQKHHAGLVNIDQFRFLKKTNPINYLDKTTNKVEPK